MTLLAILSDGFFAAVAAVGFGAVSDPPMRAFPAIALLLGGRIHCPMTVLFIPALLPMIPGMYAYKTVFSMIMFMQNLDDPSAAGYLAAIVRNGFVTFSVIFMLAAGAAAPIFLFNKRAHSLTRNKKQIRS